MSILEKCFPAQILWFTVPGIAVTLRQQRVQFDAVGRSWSSIDGMPIPFKGASAERGAAALNTQSRTGIIRRNTAESFFFRAQRNRCFLRNLQLSAHQRHTYPGSKIALLQNKRTAPHIKQALVGGQTAVYLERASLNHKTAASDTAIKSNTVSVCVKPEIAVDCDLPRVGHVPQEGNVRPGILCAECVGQNSHAEGISALLFNPGGRNHRRQNVLVLVRQTLEYSLLCCILHPFIAEVLANIIVKGQCCSSPSCTDRAILGRGGDGQRTVSRQGQTAVTVHSSLWIITQLNGVFTLQDQGGAIRQDDSETH